MSPFPKQPYDPATVKTADLLSALNPIVEILLANADTITADEDVGMLITSDDSSTEIIGSAI